jgi:hypothetical protein
MLIEINFPEQMLLDQLVTAVEGGSNYWANFSIPKEFGGETQTSKEYKFVRVILDREAEAGLQKEIYDRVNESIIGVETIALGVERLARAVSFNAFPSARNCLADFILEEGDASTADVILQLALFGEVVYG